MASSDDHDILCEICIRKNVTKHADIWCPECNDGFCSECLQHHNIAKYTNRHEVISVENFKRLPRHIFRKTPLCEVHDKAYTHVCTQHECACCPYCILSEHSTCQVKEIEQIVKMAKSSSLLESIEEDIDNMITNLNSLIKEQTENVEDNIKRRETLLNDVRQLRLDRLENQILQELTATEKVIRDDSEKLKSELQKKMQDVVGLQEFVVATKQCGSKLQTFLGSFIFKKNMEEEQTQLRSLQEEGRLNRRLLKLDIHAQILEITAAFKTSQLVSIQEIPSAIDLEKEIKKRGQAIHQPPAVIPKSIDDIKLSLKRSVVVPVCKDSSYITGCVIRPNGKIILVDGYRYNRVLVLNEEGVLEKDIKYLKGLHPTDVTSVDDRTICVSFKEQRLELIDTVTCEATQVIQTDDECCGVTSYEGHLIWYEKRKGIQVQKISSNIRTTLVEDKSGAYWCYLTVYKDRIYQTNYHTSGVTCYKIGGEKVWEFRDQRVIKQPFSVAVDQDLNVYVTCEYDVVVLSPDGTKSRKLLGQNDGLLSENALYFDRKRNILLVVYLFGQRWFMYEVS